MASKVRMVYCQNQIKKIQDRIKAGKAQFGDKKRLKDFQDELDGKKILGKDW